MTKHLINSLQIERFTHFVDHDINIFPTQHSCTKNEEGEAIRQNDLFLINDKNCGATDLGLLYYCKGRPVALLINIYIPL